MGSVFRERCRSRLACAALALVSQAVIACPASAQFSSVSGAEIVSRPRSGSLGAGSELPSASPNSNMVVFQSSSPDLVPDDNNGEDDVFLNSDDSITGVNLSTAGTLGSSGAGAPSISAKSTAGEFGIAFSSASTDLVPGYAPPAAGPVQQVYLRTFPTGKTVLLSRALSSALAGASGSSAKPVVTIIPGLPLKYKVAFLSAARDMTDGEGSVTNNLPYVATVELKNGSPVVVSIQRLSLEANSDVDDIALSGDGNFVAFSTFATNIIQSGFTTGGRKQVYLWTVPAAGVQAPSVLRALSVTPAGLAGNAESYHPSLSFLGDVQTFLTEANNLLPTVNSDRPGVALRKTGSAAVVQVNTSATGEPSDGGSIDQQLSASGMRVVFSDAGSLTSSSSNGQRQVYIKNIATGEIALLSRTASGTAASSSCSQATIGAGAFNASKTLVSFVSAAQNLTTVDLKGNQAIFRSTVVSAPPLLTNNLAINAPPDLTVKDRVVKILLQAFRISETTAADADTQATKVRYRTVIQKTNGRRERILRITTRNQVTVRRLSPGRYTVRYRVTGSTRRGNVTTRFSPKQPFKLS